MKNLTFEFTQGSDCPISSPGATRRYISIAVEPGDGGVGADLRKEGLFAAPGRASEVFARACENCNECVPVRINLAHFEPGKGDRRVLRQNADVTTHVSDPYTTDDLYELYTAYNKHRHPENPDCSRQEFDEFVGLSSGMMTLRGADDKIFCFVLFERADTSLVDGLCVYAPDSMHRSPGKLSSLKMAEYAKEQGMEAIVMGSWNAAEPKWAYKANHPGVEGRTDKGWEAFRPDLKGPDFRTVLAEKGYNASEKPQVS